MKKKVKLTFKKRTESMSLKEKTINFLLFSGTRKGLRNQQEIKQPENNSKVVFFFSDSFVLVVFFIT